MNAKGEGLTPYQGRKRGFGEYKCLNCDNEWSSGSSWADTAQKCSRCDTWVYPHKQQPLKTTHDPLPDRKPHPQDLCQKCMKLGCNCREQTFDRKRHSKSLCQKCMKLGCNCRKQPLETTGDPLPDRKPHPQDLCQKCKKLGCKCRKVR